MISADESRLIWSFKVSSFIYLSYWKNATRSLKDISNSFEFIADFGSRDLDRSETDLCETLGRYFATVFGCYVLTSVGVMLSDLEAFTEPLLLDVWIGVSFSYRDLLCYIDRCGLYVPRAKARPGFKSFVC